MSPTSNWVTEISCIPWFYSFQAPFLSTIHRICQICQSYRNPSETTRNKSRLIKFSNVTLNVTLCFLLGLSMTDITYPLPTLLHRCTFCIACITKNENYSQSTHIMNMTSNIHFIGFLFDVWGGCGPSPSWALSGHTSPQISVRLGGACARGGRPHGM
jgi:hypothetical protein